GEVEAVADGALAAGLARGGAARHARARGLHDARDDGLGDGRVRVEVLLEVEPERTADGGAGVRVVEALLRLALELGIDVEEVDDGVEPLADVVGGDVELLLAEVVGVDVVADGLRDGVLHPLLVRPAKLGRDAVDEQIGRASWRDRVWTREGAGP